MFYLNLVSYNTTSDGLPWWCPDMFLHIKFSLLKAQIEMEWIAALGKKKKKSPKALKVGKGQDYFHPATACFNLTTASLSTFGSYSFTTQRHKFGIRPALRRGNDILGHQLHPPCSPTPWLDKTFEVNRSQTGARAHCLGSGGLGELENEVGRHFGSLSGPRGFVSKSLTSRCLRGPSAPPQRLPGTSSPPDPAPCSPPPRCQTPTRCLSSATLHHFS